MKQAWFIRHGETVWNLEHRVQGWTDIPLDDCGRQQAEALAHHLDGTAIDRLISSNLRRAIETAEILQRTLRQPVVVDPRLRERGLGPAEGRLRSELRDGFLMDIPGAEPLPDVHTRVRSLLADLDPRTDGPPIVCVTHGGWIRNMLQLLGMQKMPLIRNTSLTKLGFVNHQWQILDVGLTPHLQRRAKSQVNVRR